MTDRRCMRCGAALLEGSRFCTECGLSVAPVTDMASPVEEEAEQALHDDPAARLVECESCGAINAASRALCARCMTPLREEVPGGDALPDDAPAVSGEPRGVRRGVDTSPVVLSLVVLAGLVTAGVLLALVSSQFSSETTPAVPTGMTVRAATASSSLQDHSADLAIDGDPSTAWVEGASGPGTEEWLEVELPEPVEVRRLVIWNGDQSTAEAFAEHGRVASLRIEVEDRQFRVEMLDITGPQGVDLPAGVRTDRVRLVVEAPVDGERFTELAVSELVVEAAPE